MATSTLWSSGILPAPVASYASGTPATTPAPAAGGTTAPAAPRVANPSAPTSAWAGTAIVPGTVSGPRLTASTSWPPKPGPPDPSLVYAGETLIGKPQSMQGLGFLASAGVGLQNQILAASQKKAAVLTAARDGALAGKAAPIAQVGIGVALIGVGVFAGGWWYLLAAGGAVLAVRGGINLKDIIAPPAPTTTRVPYGTRPPAPTGLTGAS